MVDPIAVGSVAHSDGFGSGGVVSELVPPDSSSSPERSLSTKSSI